MFCDRCGTEANESARFCSNCGKPFGAATLTPEPQGRVAGHVRLLGILWLAIAAFRLIPGMALITIFRSPFFPPDVPMFVPALLRGIGGVFLIGGVLSGVIGYGLLARQPWARMLAIIVGAIGLADIPFGTALGVYTFWVLLPAESEREYRSASSAT